MPMKKLSIGVSFLMGILQISGQGTKTLWQKDIESSTQDILSGLVMTPDRQYLVSGSSIQSSEVGGVSSDSGSSGNSGYDFHILKLNQSGNKVWEKYFSGNKHDYLNATIGTQEGGFLLAGTSYSTLAKDKKSKTQGSSDIWVIKTNENGDELWQTSLGTKYAEEAKAITQTKDLGYVIAGNSNHPHLGIGQSDVFLTKLNPEGKIQFQIILGGILQDDVEKVYPTNDGGFLLGIYSRSSDTLPHNSIKDKLTSKEFNTQSRIQSKINPDEEEYPVYFYTKKTGGFGLGDYWVVKVDKQGKLEWEKTFGGDQDDHIKTLYQSEEGFLIGGESRSTTGGNKTASNEEGTDVWLLALDEVGNKIWEKAYNYSTRDILMSFNPIKDENLKTKGYLLGGYSQAEDQLKSDDETFWMLYIDKNGGENWRKKVEGKSKKSRERLVSALFNRDGSYVLAGTTADHPGEENWKIVKLGDKQLDDLVENKDILIYPNPVDDYAYVEIGFELKSGEEATIHLHDMSGKQIQTIKTKQQVTKINTSTLPQGVYLVSAQTPNKSANTKIVKK